MESDSPAIHDRPQKYVYQFRWQAIYLLTYLSISLSIYLCIYLSLYLLNRRLCRIGDLSINFTLPACLCLSLSLSLSLYIYIYIYRYTHIYIYIYIYIHTHSYLFNHFDYCFQDSLEKWNDFAGKERIGHPIWSTWKVFFEGLGDVSFGTYKYNEKIKQMNQ